MDGLQPPFSGALSVLMKRNLLWALFSILPAICFLFVLLITPFESRIIELIPLNWHNIDLVRFLIMHWWKIVPLTFFISYIFFLIHSCLKKRWFWFLGIFFCAVLLHPFYWWFNSEKDT